MSNKPSIDDRVEDAVNKIDNKVAPFMDKYGVKIVVGFLALIVIGIIVQQVL